MDIKKEERDGDEDEEGMETKRRRRKETKMRRRMETKNRETIDSRLQRDKIHPNQDSLVCGVSFLFLCKSIELR